MFDATRLASSIVICFASMASTLGRAAIDICHGKTVCVAHHVAAGKFLGAPWGRKVARHFAGPRRVNAAHSSIPNHQAPLGNCSPRQLIGLRFAATLCLRVSSALLWPRPKYANPPPRRAACDPPIAKSEVVNDRSGDHVALGIC